MVASYVNGYSFIPTAFLIKKNVTLFSGPTPLHFCLIASVMQVERHHFIDDDMMTDVRVLNTGAPQGCVLSPVLFSIYTNDLKWNSTSGNKLTAKYADDTIVIGLITNDNSAEYLKCVDFVSKWCKDNFLQLNVTKTKDMKIDFRRNRNVNHPAIMINNAQVDVCTDYKYLVIVPT